MIKFNSKEEEMEVLRKLPPFAHKSDGSKLSEKELDELINFILKEVREKNKKQ